VSLKAVLFDFNGVIINDEPLHKRLTEQLLIEENLALKPGEFEQIGLGRSDRGCLQEILKTRGRVVKEDYLTQLVARKAEAYVLELEKLEKLPIYPGLEDLIYQFRVLNLKLGVVSGAARKGIEMVLSRENLAEYFQVIVAGDEITTSKPEPDGYLLAVQRLNEKFPELRLLPKECLAIEDTPAGIQAAKRARMQVVGVANTYPFHMMQRLSNWAVDYLTDLEVERVQEFYLQKEIKPTVKDDRIVGG
jgi:beta-phosphoglucomutase